MPKKIRRKASKKKVNSGRGQGRGGASLSPKLTKYLREHGMHVQGTLDAKHLDMQNPVDREKAFFIGFCTRDEVDRIFAVKSAEDRLLKMRADSVVDHARLYRVIRARRQQYGDSWTFGGHFDRQVFLEVIDRIPEPDRSLCSETTAGFVFSDDPNGACVRTDEGDIVVVSESLRYFLYFMNLACLDFGEEVPLSVRIPALRIAIRTMLHSEAMDFELDPRGIVPSQVERVLQKALDNQLAFVVGHEFGHRVLKHLDSRATSVRPLLGSRSFVDDTGDSYRFYNVQQTQEFEADEWAIARPDYDVQKRMDVGYGALAFFGFLSVFEQVREQLFPSSGLSKKTHPEPLERMRNLQERVFELAAADLSGIYESCEAYRKFLEQDVAVNADAYEFYGSIYLGPWRGPKLVDRRDY